MSVEIEFYPDKATKTDLKNLLVANGFVKCKYFLDALPKGSLTFKWFDQEHFRSTDGMEANILLGFHDDPDKWFLHTRTRASASAYDRQMQNFIIKEARKNFGGHFYNDHAGKNRYTVVDVNELLQPIEGGILRIHERLKESLQNLYGSIYNIEEPFKPSIENAGHKHIAEMLMLARPDRYLYNSLLPFIVSVVEHFFKQIFIVLIKYDDHARKEISAFKLKELKTQLTFSEIADIKAGTNSIEEVIAGNYTFQNLNHVASAYIKFLRLDINAVLSKKAIGKKTLKEVLVEIIERRHDMIHHFIFAADMDKNEFIKILKVCDTLINEMTNHLEKKYNLNITAHSYFNGLFS